MTAIRELVALLRIGQTSLSVAACRFAYDRARVDLDRALLARDQARADFRITTTTLTPEPPAYLLAKHKQRSGPNYEGSTK